MITKERVLEKKETQNINWKKFSKWQSEKITNAMREKIFSLVRNQ